MKVDVVEEVDEVGKDGWSVVKCKWGWVVWSMVGYVGVWVYVEEVVDDEDD